MKLTLIDISWSVASPVSNDAKVATCIDLETLEYRPLLTFSIWRYSKISYSRIMMDNASQEVWWLVKDERVVVYPMFGIEFFCLYPKGFSISHSARIG